MRKKPSPAERRQAARRRYSPPPPEKHWPARTPQRPVNVGATLLGQYQLARTANEATVPRALAIARSYVKSWATPFGGMSGDDEVDYKGHRFRIKITPEEDSDQINWVTAGWEFPLLDSAIGERDDFGRIFEGGRNSSSYWVDRREAEDAVYRSLRKASNWGYPHGRAYARERAREIVASQIDNLVEWLNDQWYYQTVWVYLLDGDGEELDYTTLGMVSSDDSHYVDETCLELADQLIANVEKAAIATAAAEEIAMEIGHS